MRLVLDNLLYCSENPLKNIERLSSEIDIFERNHLIQRLHTKVKKFNSNPGSNSRNYCEIYFLINKTVINYIALPTKTRVLV